MRYAAAAIAGVALLVAGCTKLTASTEAGRNRLLADAAEDGATAADIRNSMTGRQIEDVQVWLAERRLERLGAERQARIESLLAAEAERQRERAAEAHQ